MLEGFEGSCHDIACRIARPQHITACAFFSPSLCTNKLVSTDNRPFSWWWHLTKTTTIHVVFLFNFKFCNPSGLIIMRKQKTLKGSGSCSY